MGTKLLRGMESLVRPRFKILAYHGVVRKDPSLYDVTRGAFAEQMRVLKEEGYAVLALDRAVAGIRANGLSGRAVVITFDDGYRNLAENAVPVLRDAGFPATVFVVSKWTGEERASGGPPEEGREVLGWDALRRLRPHGIAVGSHSVTHRDLTRLDGAALEGELSGSLEALGRRLGVGACYFAYPYGLLNRTVRNAVERCGYQGALCFGSVLSNWAATDPFELKREKILSTTTLREFREIVDPSRDLKRASAAVARRAWRAARGR